MLRFLSVLVFIGSMCFASFCITGKVSKATDGDTMHVKEASGKDHVIRLLSIDAPETHYNGASQGYYGELAATEIAKMVPLGTNVNVECGTEATDVYGRTLGYIFKGPTNINLEMVKQGLAVTYFIYPNLKYFKEFSEANVVALYSCLGMFCNLAEMPFEFRLRIGHRTPDKWVCDGLSKQCVIPKEYDKIEIPNRIFFMKEKDMGEWLNQ